MSAPLTWSPDKINFLRSVIHNHTNAEVIELFEKRYGYRLSIYQLWRVKKDYDIGPERQGNTKPIGSECVSKSGVTLVKVGNSATGSTYQGSRRGWKPKHHIVYEQTHGPIPDGHVIVFADHDMQNFDPDNLVCISRSDRMKLANWKIKGIEYWDRESLEALLAVSELNAAIMEKSPHTKNGYYSKTCAARCLKQMQANPEDPRHGTVTGYSYGCRCEACRQAHSEHEKARRRGRKKVANAR